MSLRSKVLTLIAALLGLYGVANYAVQRTIIYPSFVELERENAETDLRRCLQAIDREIEQLTASATDYGSWDDTAQFIADGNQQYAETNLTTSCLRGLGVNLLAFCNPQGKVVGSYALDLVAEEPMDIPGIPSDSFPSTHVLLQLEEPEDRVGGILLTGLGPMLVASRPVLNNEGEGPVRGAVIIGRLLNKALIAKLREQTQVHFEVLPPLANQADLAAKADSPVKPAAPEIVVNDDRQDVLAVSATLSDLSHESLVPIEATVPRNVTAKGRAALRFACGSVLAAGLVILAALLVALQWTVLGPVSRLTRHAVRVGHTDDLTARLGMTSRDEIGILATEFDRMVEQLAQARKRIVDQSYESGIAEMASGTLHNVRNALTPVLAELDLLRQELAKVPMDQIELAKQQLDDPSVPDERRQDLVKFLELANGRAIAVARDTQAKLTEVADRAKRIGQFLSDPSHASRADRPIEWGRLADLVPEAAALLPAELRQRAAIETGPGLAALGSLKMQRISLLQILANLLTNAAEAIISAGRPTGYIVVDAQAEDGEGTAMIHLWVKDDGVGITAEDLTRVFERGFSRKGGLARGLGLHWCANSVAGMKGRISAESGGPGQGACLHVWLPRLE